MLSASTNLVAVRRRDKPDLPNVIPGSREDSRSATPILQMLFSELASLKQQVNAMVVDRSSPIQPTDPPIQQTNRSAEVKPSKLRNVFD